MNDPNGQGGRFPGVDSARAVGGPRAVRLPPELRLSAASRLVSDAAGDRQAAAKRFISSAAAHGIDLDLMWGTVDRDGAAGRVRQVCLAVPGSGRTVMLFISGPGADDEAAAMAERVAAIASACEALAGESRRRFHIAQSLPDPSERWAVEAFLEAGFVRVGDLDYLRRPATKGSRAAAPTSVWPEGVVVRNVGDVARGGRDWDLLVRALDRSYERTLDCPELCGLRRTEDILESHRATGVFDRSLWWLVMLEAEPHGCMLFSRVPDQGCVELVYLGLSPALRGRGLGSRLLALGLGAVDRTGPAPVTCAVDRRNAPAIRLYERAGFVALGTRVALVKPL